ncbi:hypothetical protein NKH16_24960 [Mesorhizobium sp. M1307]|uniref:hypothetical protein n=1 Tax=Mesorhizobium sp. M1307 TaxID=2957079 RepID=UPI003335C3B6
MQEASPPAPANRRAGRRHLKKFPARQRLAWLTLCRPAIYLTTIFFIDLSSIEPKEAPSADQID